MGIKDGVNVHLWFWLERPCSDNELKTWLSGYPADDHMFNPIQIHLTANPQFRDDAKALRILRPLAAQGHAEAQKMLGTMYQFGHGVIEDHKAALEWYRLSAIQGNNDGQHGLGIMLSLIHI